MKVLYVLHTSQMHGSTLSFLNLAEGLIGKGVEVAVAGPELHEELSQRLNRLGIGYYPVRIAQSVYPQRGRLYLGRLFNLLKRKHNSLCDIQRVAETVKPDIIHTNTGVIREGYRVAKKLAIPHVWHIREYQDNDFSWQIFPSKRSFINKLHKSYVITITEDIKTYFDLHDYSRVTTIYNGVYKCDLPYVVSEKEKYFLCASRISKEKGFDAVISAFSSFHKIFPNYRLKILGDGDQTYIEHLKKKADRENCLLAIDWLGYKADVIPYMQKAKALIVASYFEGFGRMTAEACFAGCLVVGRNSGGTKEILAETGGYLFDDNMGFLDALCEVVSLFPDEYKEKALFAQQKARQLYSIEGNVEETYKFYQDILSDEQKG